MQIYDNFSTYFRQIPSIFLILDAGLVTMIDEVLTYEQMCYNANEPGPGHDPGQIRPALQSVPAATRYSCCVV